LYPRHFHLNSRIGQFVSYFQNPSFDSVKQRAILNVWERENSSQELCAKLPPHPHATPSFSNASAKIFISDAIVPVKPIEAHRVVLDPIATGNPVFTFIFGGIITDVLLEIENMKHRLQLLNLFRSLFEQIPLFTIFANSFWTLKSAKRKYAVFIDLLQIIKPQLLETFPNNTIDNFSPVGLICFAFYKGYVTQLVLHRYLNSKNKITLDSANRYLGIIFQLYNQICHHFEIPYIFKPSPTSLQLQKFEDIHPHTKEPIPPRVYFRFLTFILQYSEQSRLLGLLFHGATLSCSRMGEFLALLKQDVSVEKVLNPATDRFFYRFVLQFERSKTKRLGRGVEVTFPCHPLPWLDFKVVLAQLKLLNEPKKKERKPFLGSDIKPNTVWYYVDKWWTFWLNNVVPKGVFFHTYSKIKIGPHSARKTGCRIYKHLKLKQRHIKLASTHVKSSNILKEVYFEPTLLELQGEIDDYFNNLL